jgi:hypothetical protein
LGKHRFEDFDEWAFGERAFRGILGKSHSGKRRSGNCRSTIKTLFTVTKLESHSLLGAICSCDM